MDELPLYPARGEGGHTFVHVEKRLRTTEEVARDLARAAGVRPREVGYAGRKDRVAIATQWLSVPGLDPAEALRLSLPGVRVLAASRHPHKLRTGHLRGNRFRAVIRGVCSAGFERARERFEELCRGGMANRFDAQRFGRDGKNAERGRRILLGESVGGDRRAARFYVSALQAAVFNEVLDGRPGPLDELERGDVAVVHASGGLFTVEDPQVEAARAAAFEISATGPIFGPRAPAPTGEVARREEAVLAAHGIRLAELRAPKGIRLRGARRPLRVRPEPGGIECIPDGLEVCFRLPPGSYATLLLGELIRAVSTAVSDDTGTGAGVC